MSNAIPMRVVVWALVSAAVVVGCSREPDRSTPEATIRAARLAVERGDARRIGAYIYSENEDTRRLMARLGVFLGNVQKLGNAIQEKFPEQVAEMKAKAEQAAKDGKTTSLLAQLSSQFRPQRGRNRASGPPPSDTRTLFDEALKNLFADPYGWLEESEARLTTTYLTDNSVAMLWDEQPILPPIGMVMKKGEDGLWYFLLPTNLPGVSNFMPKTKEQFEIFGGIIVVFDNVVLDLTEDVRSGKLRSLDDVSRKAGEKAFIPAAMMVFAYSKLNETQKKEAKALAEAKGKP